MAAVLVDTNVIIDAAQPGSPWHAWSAAQLERAADTGGVCINPIIYAELAGYIDSDSLLDELLAEMLLERANCPGKGRSPQGVLSFNTGVAAATRPRRCPISISALTRRRSA